MKVQYLGDINDYRKYTLLRKFKQVGFKLGVCWVMTDSDGSTDGGKRGYLNKPDRWERFDPDVFKLLSKFYKEAPLGSLDSFEISGIIPGAVYFSDITPDSLIDRN